MIAAMRRDSSYIQQNYSHVVLPVNSFCVTSRTTFVTILLTFATHLRLLHLSPSSPNAVVMYLYNHINLRIEHPKRDDIRVAR